MKFFTAFIAVSLSLAAFAAPQDFAKIKAHVLQSIEKDIAIATEAKKCVTAATTLEILNQCNQDRSSKQKAKNEAAAAFWKSQQPAAPKQPKK